MLKDILSRHRTEILSIASRHGCRDIRVFGSVARGEERADSDVDFLVEVGEETSPWFPAGLIADLEQLLHRRVDVVTTRALDPLVRESVSREALSV